MPRFKVGDYMKGRKMVREEVLMKKRGMEEELQSIGLQIKEKKKELKAKTDRLRYLDSKVCVKL